MISNAEWEIMRVIWTKGQVTSTEVTEVLAEYQSWSASTVKTLLARLVEKGVVKYEKDGRAFVYTATVSEDDLNQAELDAVLDHICQRKHADLLLSVLENVPMTQEQVLRFQAILSEKGSQVLEKIPCNCQPGQCHCKEHLGVKQ